MKVRIISISEEYEKLSGWWTLRGLIAPSQVLLQAATGVVVHAGAVDLVAGWIYVSNLGHLGFVEWVTSNPAVARGETSKQALEVLYDFMDHFAQVNRLQALFTTTPESGSLRRFLEPKGWNHCPGEPHIHLLKSVAP